MHTFTQRKIPYLLIFLVLLFSSCAKLILNQTVSKYNKYNGLELPELMLEDISGNMVNTSSFKGRVVLLNTWGTWCSLCINELPGLNSINKKLNGNATFILVNVCAKSDKEEWKKIVADKKLTGINLFLPDSLFNRYNVFNIDNEGWPYNIILGKDGKILGGGIEVDPDGENLLAIYPLLKAEDNVDAKSSVKEMITLSKKIKKIDEPEMKDFKAFLEKYTFSSKH